MPEWLLDAALPVAGLRAGTVLRQAPGLSSGGYGPMNLGARCGDDPAAVAENRRWLQRELGLPEPPRWLAQVHGRRVAVLPFDGEPEADAACSPSGRGVLAVLSADCLPLVLADRHGPGFAVVHAGWRGLAAGVIEASVEALAVDPRRLCAWLGPAAGAERYEVGDEVRAACLTADPGGAAAFRPTRPGHWTMDLCALARRRLQGAGLGAAAIGGGRWCTIADARRFHSFRRDGRASGRMATLAWRDPQPTA